MTHQLPLPFLAEVPIRQVSPRKKPRATTGLTRLALVQHLTTTMYRQDLTPGHVLALILMGSHPTGLSRGTYQHLSGMHETTARRTLTTLVSLGYAHAAFGTPTTPRAHPPLIYKLTAIGTSLTKTILLPDHTP